MKTQSLGNTDLGVPPIIFGGNLFGWTLSEKESFEMLNDLLQAAFNTIDTADGYSRWADGNEGGESETFVYNALGLAFLILAGGTTFACT